MVVHITFSIGDYLDRLGIWEIKAERVQEPAKLRNIEIELAELHAAGEHLVRTSEIESWAAELKRVNERLWDVEDQIRLHDRNGDFGAPFVELARAVYRLNDERAELKRQINVSSGSRLVDEKSYESY